MCGTIRYEMVWYGTIRSKEQSKLVTYMIFVCIDFHILVINIKPHIVLAGTVICTKRPLYRNKITNLNKLVLEFVFSIKHRRTIINNTSNSIKQQRTRCIRIPFLFLGKLCMLSAGIHYLIQHGYQYNQVCYLLAYTI